MFPYNDFSTCAPILLRIPQRDINNKRHASSSSAGTYNWVEDAGTLETGAAVVTAIHPWRRSGGKS